MNNTFMHKWKFLVEPIGSERQGVAYWKATPINGTEKTPALISHGSTPEDAVFNARRRVIRWEEGHRDGDMA
jgi:hypothetical protein